MGTFLMSPHGDIIKVARHEEIGAKRIPTWRREKSSESHEVELDLPVAVLYGPQVQGNGCNLVHHGHGQAVDRQVNGLEVALAHVTGLDPDRGNAFGGITWKIVVMLFPTRRTKDSAELPFRLAEGAEQQPLPAVAFWPDDGELGIGQTVGTLVPNNLRPWSVSRLRNPFRLGLEQYAREERPPVVTAVGSGQPQIQNLANLRSGCAVQPRGFVCQLWRTV